MAQSGGARVMGGGSITWEVARAAGMTSLVLLTLSAAAGLVLSLKLTSPRWPRFVTNELHNFVTLLSLVFLVVHVIAVLADPFTRFGLADILVPFATPYRTLWMTLGIVALYLLLAVRISSSLQKRIGYRIWRRLHFLAFAVYALALVHGIATGSDTRTWWAGLIYLSSVATVLALTMARMLRSAARSGQPRHGAVAAMLAVVVVGFAWALGGPFRAGWSARANGTASSTRVAASAGATAAAVAADPFTRGFAAPLKGSMRQQGPDSQGLVTLRIGTVLAGRTAGMLEVVLKGTPTQGGGVQVAGSRVLLGTSPSSPLYDGQLVSLQGGDMTALVSHTDGSTGSLSLHIVLTSLRAGDVRGTVSATRA